MPFSQSVIDQAFKRSGGRCECTLQHEGERAAPHHGVKCPRGFPEVWGWQPNFKVHEDKGGKDALENCEVFCKECYQLANKSADAVR